MVYTDDGSRTHFQRKDQRLAHCWKLTLTNGGVVRATDHDSQLTLTGPSDSSDQPYIPNPGFSASAQSKDKGDRPTNRTLSAFLQAGYINTAQILAGFLDGATLEEFVVDWMYPWVGIAAHEVYEVSRHDFYDLEASMDVVGLADRLTSRRGHITEESCALEFLEPGGRCGIANCQQLSLGPAFDPTEIITRHNIDVSAVDFQNPWLGKQAFTSSGSVINGTNYPHLRDNYFKNSVIRWTFGANIGLVSRVAFFNANNNRFELVDPLPNNITTTDGYTLTGFKRTGMQPASVTSRREFVGPGASLTVIEYPLIQNDYFAGSKLVWTGGNNAGITSRVRGFTLSTLTFVLDQDLPFNIQTSDTFTLYEACDRLKDSVLGCRRHNNFINFFGAAYKPGSDEGDEVAS